MQAISLLFPLSFGSKFSMLWPRTGRKKGQNGTSFSVWICKALLFVATDPPANTDGQILLTQESTHWLPIRNLCIGYWRPCGPSTATAFPDVKHLSLASLCHPILAPITGNSYPCAAGPAVAPYRTLILLRSSSSVWIDSVLDQQAWFGEWCMDWLLIPAWPLGQAALCRAIILNIT